MDKDKFHHGYAIFALGVVLVLALGAVIIHQLDTLSTDVTNRIAEAATSAETQAQTDTVAGTDASQDGEDEVPHTHDWTITYKTVHHDAVTHTEQVPATYGTETTYHTVCNDCHAVIDGAAQAHLAESGHRGYSTNVPITNEVVLTEATTREVIDQDAWDESVPDQAVCTTCGATEAVPAALQG